MKQPAGVIPLDRPVSVFPRRFGQHVLIRKLAEGGMAELFLAKQVGAEGFERTVVIKCMLEHFSRSPEFREMFLDEARLAARLFHPNIVQITDLGVAEERHFICMEYLPGEDLETLIQTTRQRGEPVPIALAVRILISACEGLEFAHGYQEGGRRMELVHRDVSPSNIFVTFQGVVKVLDFGIAKASSRVTSTQPGTLKGKWGYMSPEQARGEVLDARSDLFSLGVTFYELLTGRRMVEKDNEVGVLMALMQQDNPPPSSVRPEIPAALDAIVLKAIARDREQRYQNAAELRAELERFLFESAPVTGSSQLSHYMQALFGSEWVARKSNIPTLRELGELGVQPSAAVVEEAGGLERTFVRPSVPEMPAGQEKAAPPIVPVPAAEKRPSRTGGIVIGAVGAVLLVGIAAAGALVVAPERVALVLGNAPAPVSVPAPTPVEPVALVPEVAEPEEPAEAPVEEPPTGGVTTVATAVEPEPETPVVIPPKRRDLELTSNDVVRVLQRRVANLTACGERFRNELPTDMRAKVLLTISHAGKVSGAETSLTDTSPRLRACLLEELQRLKFPRNANVPEFQYNLVLTFAKGG